jgi:hypothetical protein
MLGLLAKANSADLISYCADCTTLGRAPLRLRSTNKYLRVKRPRKSSDPAAAAAHLNCACR